MLIKRYLLALCVCFCSTTWAFQLAPAGSAFEEKLTNESPSTRGKIAGALGLLLKGPVHEEITQLGFGCPTSASLLQTDKSCAGSDHPFATAFVIYGVRWNDLPPFRLDGGEGKSCKKLFSGTSACKVEQTIRFSTQPDCWYCLFNEAQKKSRDAKIAGCRKGEEGYIAGNLMTRSHFGDLQFLHGMANEDNVLPGDTRQKVLNWLEFAWKVSSREISPTTLLRDIDNPTIREHFGCSEWTVADIYVLGQQKQLLPRIRDIAFGSVLHTVQDSFARGHTERESVPVATAAQCPGAPQFEQPGKIVEFHSYSRQDGHKHDLRDERSALLDIGDASRFPAAVEATKNLADLYGASWVQAGPYMECLFELSRNAKSSTPGQEFQLD